MLTFQILDGGEPFYVPLEGRPVVIGSDPTADIRLGEADVAPRHARVEPVRQGDATEWKLVDLTADSGDGAFPPTRVNGRDVAQVRLALGDRVEIGCAVLVLGQRVTRATTARDVLDDGLRATRSTRRRPESGGAPKKLIALIAVAVTLTALLVVFLGGDTRPGMLDLAQRHRKSGDFVRATEVLDALQKNWASGSESREAVLATERAAVEATRLATERERRRVEAEAATRPFAELLDELRAHESSADVAFAEAARIVRSELPEIRQQALARSGGTGTGTGTGGESRSPAVADGQAARPNDAPGGSSDAAPTVGAPADAATKDAVAKVIDQIDAMERAGEFGQAYELLVQGMATFPQADALRLRDRLDAMRVVARAEIDRRLAAANELVAAGRLADAVEGLRGPAARFPATGELGGLWSALGRLQSDLDAERTAELRPGARPVDAIDAQAKQLRNATIGSLTALLDDVRRAELACEWERAAELLRQGAESVRAKDPLFARLLDGKAADLGWIATFEDEIGERASQKPVDVTMRGAKTQLVGVSEHRWRFGGGEGDTAVAVLDVPIEVLSQVVDRAGSTPKARLGFAVLAYRNGAADLAEAQLARAWAAEGALADAIQDVVRRGRTEPPDPKGYALVKGRIVSQREITSERLAKEFESKLAQALTANDAQRAKIVEGILEGGPESLDALLLALQRKQKDIVARIEKHAFRKTVEKFAAERQKLDAAREHAKALIYDETAYFYPYRPPAVDEEKAKAYWPVQRDVDERVAVVRELWKSKERARVPKALLDDAASLRWIGSVLAEFGAADAAIAERTSWVRCLPDDGNLTLQTFSVDEAEKAKFALWQRIEAFDDAKASLMSDAERQQVRVTNEYRRMFGHRPLAVNPKLLEAARGHSEEMSRLGYFGHFSPVAGRRTPFDRMRLAGYAAGVGENCAINDSAVSAHDAWLHSSGHHRNLLSPGHTEFAVGNAGRYWTQNFGRGTEYEQDPDFGGR